jgi:allantoate deiminase
MAIDQSAQTVMNRCDALGGHSEEPDRLTRRFGTPAMRQANEAVAGWMRAAGMMQVRQDNVGNVVGRYEASEGGGAGARTLLLGSHLDTVRDAGRYDGPLGVLVALACVERLHARGERLPYAVEVYGFADEEGLRFHSAYLGSSAVAGTLGPETLGLTDEAGLTLAEAIRVFGGDPVALAADARSRDDLLGYCEVHIEQGPVLEARGLPVGVVTAIQGQSRVAVGFSGEAGHAGTVPMELRRDALCAAAELILAAEGLARSQPRLVATVGQIAARPGASNVIPGQASLSLDVRHPDDTAREEALRQLEERARVIAEARRVALEWRRMQDHPTVPCAPRLTRLLAQGVEEAEGHPAHLLPSGAGHDVVPLAELTEIAMLFVRCRGGVSHHPAEAVEAADVAVAIAVLERFLELLAIQVQERGGA